MERTEKFHKTLLPHLNTNKRRHGVVVAPFSQNKRVRCAAKEYSFKVDSVCVVLPCASHVVKKCSERDDNKRNSVIVYQETTSILISSNG